MKNSKETLKNLIELIKDSTGLTQQQVSSKAGYKINSLSQALAKPTGHEPVIRQLKLVFKDVLENPIQRNDAQSHGMSAQTILNLTESNRLMAEANKLQSEANRIQAESNRQLVESNRDMIAVMKATVGVGEEIPASVAAKFEDLLEVLAEVASGKSYRSHEEAAANIRRLFYGGGQHNEEKGTLADMGMRNKQ